MEISAPFRRPACTPLPHTWQALWHPRGRHLYPHTAASTLHSQHPTCMRHECLGDVSLSSIFLYSWEPPGQALGWHLKTPLYSLPFIVYSNFNVWIRTSPAAWGRLAKERATFHTENSSPEKLKRHSDFPKKAGTTVADSSSGSGRWHPGHYRKSPAVAPSAERGQAQGGILGQGWPTETQSWTLTSGRHMTGGCEGGRCVCLRAFVRVPV